MTQASGIEGRELAERVWPKWPSLSGAPVPPTDEFDVAAWREPHAFVVHRREELALALALVFVFFPYRLVDLFGYESWELYGVDTLAASVAGSVTLLLVPATVVLLAFRTQIPRAGWLTIDPVGRRVEWRRRSRAGGEAERSWAFSELRIVGLRDGGRHVDAARSAALTFALPTGDLMIRVPRGKASQLAESLGRAGVEGEV